jgi:hypothetical protein
MGKLDGQDDGLLQRLLGHLEPRDVIPADVGLVYEDRARETRAQLFHLGILIAVIVVLPESGRRAPSRHRSALHQVGDGETLTSSLHHRVRHSPSHLLLSLVAHAFHLLVTGVP